MTYSDCWQGQRQGLGAHHKFNLFYTEDGPVNVGATLNYTTN